MKLEFNYGWKYKLKKQVSYHMNKKKRPHLDFSVENFRSIPKISSFLSFSCFYFDNLYFDTKLYFHNVSVLVYWERREHVDKKF
jgi:hypothetical protein